MPSRDEVAYFGAGPAPLPTPVLEKGAQAFLNYANTGLSLAEISHRSPTANQILADTKVALTELLDIPDNYEVLFMHGGGSGEFSAVVFNMIAHWVEKRRKLAERECNGDAEQILERVRAEVRNDLRLDYLVTGSWSLKASQEAAALLEPLGGNPINVAFDARKHNGGKFGTIPDEQTWSLTADGAAFAYYCDNETVDGVEFPHLPKSTADRAATTPIVADMSSNFLSRRVDVSKHAVIFGGAQKNIGITDVTLVIVRKDILAERPPVSFLHAIGVWSPPVVFNWSVIAKNNSLYNTMPIFSIWIAGEVMRSLIKQHGTLDGQERLSNEKAQILYTILDSYPQIYQIVPHESVRSRMNICFRIRNGDAESEKIFLQRAEAKSLQGLKGHRSVGGIRISNYNAVPMANVERLATHLKDFALKETVDGT